jgi:hypothetical protein
MDDYVSTSLTYDSQENSERTMTYVILHSNLLLCYDSIHSSYGPGDNQSVYESTLPRDYQELPIPNERPWIPFETTIPTTTHPINLLRLLRTYRSDYIVVTRDVFPFSLHGNLPGMAGNNELAAGFACSTIVT